MRQRLLRVVIAIGLLVTVLAPAQPVAAATFCDVPPGSPYYDAVTQLAARGVIGGYDNGCFGPGDATLRAQMAALIARAMGWNNENHGTPFPDRGPVDDNLWRNVGTLAHYNVARGYQDGTYQPTGTVLYAQTISFISRAMVAKQLWTARGDNPALYPNVPVSSGHRADIATYVANAGRLPGTSSTTQQWVVWDQPSTRGWFALALWQAISPGSATPTPTPSPSVAVSPSSGPVGTQFIATATGAPAGAAISWAFTYAGSQTNSGSFTLNPSQTAFNFTADSTGSAAGLWTLIFRANGQTLGTVTYTVTAPRDNYALAVQYGDNCYVFGCRPGNTMSVAVQLTNNSVGVSGATTTAYWTIAGEIAPPFQGNPKCASAASGANGVMICSVAVPPVSYCNIWGGNSVYIDIYVRYGSQTFTEKESVTVTMDCR